MNFKQAHNITLQEFEYNHSMAYSKTLPCVYQIEFTNACPMNCIMCVRQKMTRPLGYMEEGVFKNIVDQIKGINTHIILNHFGESLLHPKLYEFLYYLKKKNIPSLMSANPTELSQEKIEAVCRGGLTKLILSIDGLTDSTYKSIRGPHADLDIAKENIENLIEYKNKFGFKYPEIEIQMVLMKKTENEMQDYKKQWDKPGINRVVIKDFYIWSCSTENIKSLTGVEKINPLFPCSIPWSSFVILWDGRVVPCCNDYDGLYILGDVKHKSLKEIWNDKPMLELRKQQIKNQLKNNKLCCNCTVKAGNKPQRLYPFTFNLWFIKRMREKFKWIKEGIKNK